ncbi:MAG TPA: CDP-2,3-bis-(O-geranylgeranyl)-sn-glycerol synthase [Archaeoglobus profundus]|nr:CDP-2,3-bis-(O-geranylgeranyl)-sn-glycerol synthase [Archaeoglobus profundus]
MLDLVLKTIWLLLPAYTPNNFAVVFGGGTPIDLGKKFIDGRRILGDGKTIRGFVAGVLGGLFVAHVQFIIEPILTLKIYSKLPYIQFFQLVFLLAFGSMVGDLVGSFIKRRFGVERGKSFPILDQLTFLIVAYLFASLTYAFKLLFTLDIIILSIFITPILHLIANVIAYMLKLKEVPW